MRILCDDCNTNCNIEKYKERLENIIVKTNYNLLDDEVIYLSQFLDDMIANCVFCETNNLYKFNKKYTFKAYEILYYYGKQHLFLNLFYYISEAIKNDKLIYIIMEEELYENLIKTLIINRVNIDNIKLKALEDIILGEDEYRLNETSDLFSSNYKKKQSGVNWIIEPLHITNTSVQKYILDLKVTINKFMKNSKSSILYVYDAYECMHEHKIASKLDCTLKCVMENSSTNLYQ
ncbi:MULTISPECIES: MEDS domain-containing protein [Clostridium]|uniref:MEDS domain-containing protein n=1 Tax=Clostridium TaxID=1485 RepID=UPI000983AA0E|nr:MULTISPECIES: MEDS domain-containing protein [Clostridium]AQR94938.1 hypothetical protein CLSAP_22520 [Clostridium saccharoperbutylacetonicum]NSB30781.1 hypothetical protein [Clostridium saccharoperbutylacetonicum]